MQIMTKINDFEEIFFEGSIIFHIFAQTSRQKRTKASKNIVFGWLSLLSDDIKQKFPTPQGAYFGDTFLFFIR